MKYHYTTQDTTHSGGFRGDPGVQRNPGYYVTMNVSHLQKSADYVHNNKNLHKSLSAITVYFYAEYATRDQSRSRNTEWMVSQMCSFLSLHAHVPGRK